MNETQFIELALRYLDQAASASEAERLGAAMLDNPSRRSTYRDLAQQAQLAHEWHSSERSPATDQRPRKIRLFATTAAAAAAAAAVIVAAVFLLRPAPSPPTGETADQNELPRESPFDDPSPSWSDIYPSLFDYPDFVWHSELRADRDTVGSIDEFSDIDSQPLLASTPAAEFRRLLAPIVLLPDSSASGDWGLN